MNHLFIELYLDEDIDVLVAEILRSKGFNAITTRDAGQLGKSDLEQLDFAISQKRALLTRNRVHFEKLNKEYKELERIHYGIIIPFSKYDCALIYNLVFKAGKESMLEAWATMHTNKIKIVL